MGQSTDELTRDIEETRRNLAGNVDELTDKVSPSRIAQRRKQAMGSRLRSFRNQVMGTAQVPGEALSSAGHTVNDTASTAVDVVEEKTQGNPLAAGLVAFGAGMVIASLFPATEPEAQMAQRGMDTAREQGQPILDEAKSVGQEMAQDLKESAGQAAEEVKATARDSAEQVRQEAQTSGEHMREATPGM